MNPVKLFLNTIAEDRDLIIYRKSLRPLCGSVKATILFSQILYWDDKYDGEFYKFKSPCNHEKYKKGQSWVEELGFTEREFDTAIKKIGFKFGKTSRIKGESKEERELRKNKALVLYYRDSKGMTWYRINRDSLSISQFVGYLDSDKKSCTSSTETTTETTSFSKEKDIGSQANRKNNSDADLLKVIKKNKSAYKKIVKKPKTKPVVPKKPVYKPRYKINATDTAWYIALKIAGATNHREGTKSKAKTFDMIHALAKHSMANPYNILPDVSDFYKNYKWTREEIIEIFQYQLKHCSDFGYKPIKNFAHFIITKNYNGDNRVWSPLIFWHKQFDKKYDGKLSDDGKKLLQALEFRKVPEYKKFTTKDLNDIADWCVELTKDYVLLTGDDINGTYKLGIISVFAEYAKRMAQKDRSFRYFWVKGWDKFGEFKRYAVKNGMIKLRQR